MDKKNGEAEIFSLEELREVCSSSQRNLQREVYTEKHLKQQYFDLYRDHVIFAKIRLAEKRCLLHKYGGFYS